MADLGDVQLRQRIGDRPVVVLLEAMGEPDHARVAAALELRAGLGDERGAPRLECGFQAGAVGGGQGGG